MIIQDGEMGNVLQKQVYPGGLVSNAQPHLEGRGYEVHEQYALLHRDKWERNVTVVFFHGNLEDVSRTADTWAFLRAVETIGFEYPGYGWRAREVPSQHALLAEVPFQADFVTKTSGERGVILIGRSLGTFAALNLAVALGPEKCIGVVLISPLLTAVATKVPPPFHRAFGLIDYADNESLAPRLDPNIPVFVAHGESDIVVPLSNAKELWKGFPFLCRPKTCARLISSNNAKRTSSSRSSIQGTA
jgi:pimeloyl-ACP methyl ester carboxylesterase